MLVFSAEQAALAFLCHTCPLMGQEEVVILGKAVPGSGWVSSD